MRYKIFLLTMISALFISSSGCIPTRDFEFIEDAIRSDLHSDIHLKTNFKFSFGPVSISTIRLFVDLADADNEAEMYLKEIKRVQIGVYEVRHNRFGKGRVRIPLKVRDKLEEMDYELFINARERGEHVNLYFKELNRYFSSLYIIVFEDDELVILEVRGNLENMIEKAIQEHGVPGDPKMKI
ncbi:DUF4252 domain-containing protein [candidate division KSB1 bacterium]|nr:DUF4252 domain-containing protein [candidate division KSB1 bacterium]